MDIWESLYKYMHPTCHHWIILKNAICPTNMRQGMFIPAEETAHNHELAL
jgi:hypothetical protein